MKELQKFKIPIIAGLATLVIALIVLLAWIVPQGHKLSALNAQNVQLTTQQQTLQLRLVQLQHEKQTLPANCAELSKLLIAVPGQAAYADFDRQVTSLAVASGDPNTPSLSVTSAAASAAGVPAGVESIQVSLSVAGDYGQISTFIDGLDSFPRLFTISQLGVTGGPIISGGSPIPAGTPNYTVQLTGSIYFSSTQQNLCTTALTAPAAS